MPAKKLKEASQAKSPNTFGHWAFVLGMSIAVVEGFLPKSWTGTILWILLILGVVVGYLNITKEETSSFLVATSSLIVITLAKFTMTQIPPKEFGEFLANTVGNFAFFIVPSALIITVKSIYSLAKD